MKKKEEFTKRKTKMGKMQKTSMKMWEWMENKSYIDGLFEYVSNGCEENVVLNLVITF